MITKIMNDHMNYYKSKAEILFMKDVSMEGKKSGYNLAANEYKRVFQEIENEYDKIDQLLKNRMKKQKQLEQELLERMEKLKETRDELMKKADEKTGTVFSQLHISFCNTEQSPLYLSYGAIADAICVLKKRQWNKEKEKGYKEAKKIYIEKVEKLQNNLEEIIRGKGFKTREILLKIKKQFDEIIKIQMNIAELNCIIWGIKK